MENQHRQIIGYRDLTKEEIDLMNEIKAKGHEMAVLLEKVRKHVHVQTENLTQEVAERHKVTEPYRWLAKAKNAMQDGIMFATRAVAQPDDGF